MRQAIIIAWALAAAGLASYLMMVMGDVTYVVLADGRREARNLPLIFKLLLPFSSNFDRFIGEEWAAAESARLMQAGYEGVMTGREFAAIKIMMLFLLPDLWIYGEIKRRHTAIMRSLPFVLDLLTLSVEAGMDFVSALQRNCEAKKMTPLNEELLRMTKEIQVGSSRKEALKNMAARVNEPNLRSFASALIQADELGVPIGTMLRIQAEQMRAKRFDYAEQMAAKAPVKMLGPLMLFIFPAVFIVLLMPILSETLKGIF